MVVLRADDPGDGRAVEIVLLGCRVVVYRAVGYAQLEASIVADRLAGWIDPGGQVRMIALHAVVIDGDMHARSGIVPPDARNIDIEMSRVGVRIDQVPLLGGPDVGEQLQPV